MQLSENLTYGSSQARHRRVHKSRPPGSAQKQRQNILDSLPTTMIFRRTATDEFITFTSQILGKARRATLM